MRIKRIRPTPEQLTDREREAVIYIERYLAASRWKSPSIREIADHLGLSVGGTHELICRLVKWGYLSWRSSNPRRGLHVKRSLAGYR